MFRVILLTICGLLVSTSCILADAGWKAKESAHFTVFYREGYEQEVDELLSILEHYREKVGGLTGNRDIAGRSFITLHDTGMAPGGYYYPDTIGILPYPPREVGVENWTRLVAVHEYAHRMHLTNTQGLPKLATRLFTPLFHPNIWTSGWIAEGFATYAESQSSPYEGSLNAGYFSSYLNSRAKEGRFPSLNTVIHSPFEYPYEEDIYLYGGLFFQYLSLRYGEEKFSRFFSSIGSSILSYLGPIFPYFSLDRAAKKVYGKSIKKLFLEWRLYEEERPKEWEMEGERLTNHGDRISFPIIYQDKLYYVREYSRKTGAYEYFSFCKIVEWDLEEGKEKVILPLTSSVHTPIRIKEDKLYYAILDMGRGYKSSNELDLGYISSVYEYDFKTRKNRLLFKDEVRSFSPISPSEIIYAKDKKGEFGSSSSIFIYSIKEGKKSLLFEVDYIIKEILPTPKGIFVVARKDWRNWGIYKLRLEDGTLTPLIDTPFDEVNISFEKGTLYFTANYEKVSRLYGYNIENGALFRLTEKGFSDYPIVDTKDNRLYFVGLTSRGADLFSMELKKDEFKLPEYKESKIPEFSPFDIKEKGYIENLKTLFPKDHFPVFGNKLGIYLAGRDAVGENSYVFIPHLTKDKRLGLEMGVESKFFKPHTFFFGLVSNDSLRIGWKYPLLIRVTPGLTSHLDVSFEGGSRDKLKERYITPGVELDFRFPRLDGYLLTKYYVGSKDSGLKVSSSIRRYISRSRLGILIDYDYKKEIKPRTSDKNVDNLLTLEYSFPLLKIRRGLWNPNIYLEDLCLIFFGESSFGKKEPFWGGGVELKQEISCSLLATKFPLLIGLGIDEDGKGEVYGGVHFRIPF